MIRSYRDRLLTRDGMAAILVTILPLIYFLPAVCGAIVLCPDDGIIQNVPLRVVVADLIRAGHAPLWNPFIFCGMPLLGAAQAGVLFPLNWFYLLFSAPVATNLMMLSAYMLAALGAFLYARRSGPSIRGAVVTSLVWQGSAFLVGQVGHTNIVHTAALLPWLLWAIDGYAENGDRRRGVIVAVIVALQCFAGHQQTFVYSLLVAGAYALVMWRASSSAGNRRPAYLWSLMMLAAGLALAAVQILPTLELLKHSLRNEASYDFFSSFSMPRRFLWTFFAPYVMGGGDGNLFRAPYVGPSFYAEYVGYVGLATLALTFLALIFKRDAKTTFWAIVVVAGIVLALGRYAPLEFYGFIYAVPVLNLFRVPARHMMEVEFALAVLAGRGLTALMTSSDRARVLKWGAVAGATVFLLTCLAITVGRPADFRLAQAAPVSILRAPELFLPPLIALLSAWALWFLAKRKSIGALAILIAVLLLDLNLWGQFAGWRVASPRAKSEIWSEPPSFKFLRTQEEQEPGTNSTSRKRPLYRVLTQDHFFDPDQPVSYSAPIAAWAPALQPNICTMWGWENAAGYEGFGLARYSQLAGDMKVWGDLTDPERTLRSESREIDLLNVRYLLARSGTAPAATAPAAAPPPPPLALEKYGGHTFAKENFGLPGIVAGERISFAVSPTEIDHLALTTVLAFSENVPDGTVVARIQLRGKDGEKFEFELLAGEHTSEWAHDRADLQSRIKHKRAPLATSYIVADAQPSFEGHDYVSAFNLSQPAVVIGGEITLQPLPDAPNLMLNVGRISLLYGTSVVPVRKEWVTTGSLPKLQNLEPRWKRRTDAGPVAIFENTRVLPRAWLATAEHVVSAEQELAIIRSGKMPDGSVWDPLEQVLVGRTTGVTFPTEKGPRGRADIVRHEPNRVELTTETTVPTVLVLAENYYPGWQAHVDGRRVKTIRVNYNQRGVVLSRGRHTVMYNYQPRSVQLGFMISLVTLVSLLGWAAAGRAWSRHAPVPEGQHVTS
ncbi:MAG TPA: YfhO family protein [Chthoniobacterales bacterium]|nr:YfhO family protein [Chthoniobacterales bacterium]